MNDYSRGNNKLGDYNMKKLTLLLMLVLSLVLATGVSAQLTVDAVALGSSGQDAEENVSATFQVTNTGTDTVTGISISTTADNKFTVGFTNVPTQLTAGEVATVTVSGFLHKDLNAISGFNEAAQTIGNIVATGTNSSSATVSGSNTLTMQIENQLEIKKVRITVNGEETHSLDDGEDVDNLKPGDTLEITVEIENNFNGNDEQDVDFDDAEIIIEVDDDDDIDLDNDEEEVDVDADSDADVDFDDVQIEYEASGSYTLEITVKAHRKDTASGSGIHGQKIRIDLDVERESHEIYIISSSVKPGILACDKNSIEATVKIVNIGKRDEDETAVEVAIPELGISEIREDINLDKSDEMTRRVPLLLPTDVPAGTYSVEVNTYWNNDVLSDQRVSQLIVQECNAVDDTTVVVSPPVPVVTAPPTTTAPTTTVTSARSQSGGSFLDSTAGLASMVLGILVVLAIIIFLVVLLVRKPTV